MAVNLVLALLLLKLLRCAAVRRFFRSKSLLQVCNLIYVLVREASLSQQLESDRFRLDVNLSLVFFDRNLGDLSIIKHSVTSNMFLHSQSP